MKLTKAKLKQIINEEIRDLVRYGTSKGSPRVSSFVRAGEELHDALQSLKTGSPGSASQGKGTKEAIKQIEQGWLMSFINAMVVKFIQKGDDKAAEAAFNEVHWQHTQALDSVKSLLASLSRDWEPVLLGKSKTPSGSKVYGPTEREFERLSDLSSTINDLSRNIESFQKGIDANLNVNPELESINGANWAEKNLLDILHLIKNPSDLGIGRNPEFLKRFWTLFIAKFRPTARRRPKNLPPWAL